MRILFIILSLALLAGPADARTLVSEAKALKAAFPAASQFVPRKLSPTAVQLQQLGKALGRKASSVPRLFEARDENQESLGWAFIDSEPGKFLPMDYLVAVSPQGTILEVQLLVYRETHGHEVRSRRFRSQFKGKSLDDPIQLDRDIDAVSGATISSRTFTFGAKKCLWLARHVLLSKTKTNEPSEETP